MKLYCFSGSAFSELEVQVGDVLKENLRGQVLGHQVGAVHRTVDLDEGDDLLGQLLLQPKSVDVDVPYLGDPLSLKDPLRGRCIEVELHPLLVSEVGEQRDETEALAGSLDDAVELGLRRALGYHRLSFRPCLDAMAPNHGCSP